MYGGFDGVLGESFQLPVVSFQIKDKSEKSDESYKSEKNDECEMTFRRCCFVAAAAAAAAMVTLPPEITGEIIAFMAETHRK